MNLMRSNILGSSLARKASPPVLRFTDSDMVPASRGGGRSMDGFVWAWNQVAREAEFRREGLSRSICIVGGCSEVNRR